MAQLSSKKFAGFEQQPGEDFHAAWKRQSSTLDDLSTKAAALPAGEIVGGVLKFHVADGYAIYLVIKDKPLTLQHLAHGDGYQADPALIRGLRRSDIEQHINREKEWARLATRKFKPAS